MTRLCTLLLGIVTIAIPTFARNNNSTTQLIEINILTPEEENCIDQVLIQESVNGQGELQIVDLPEEEPIFTHPEESPVFPGGLNSLSMWIAHHLIYPTSAAEQDIQGKVVVKFVVTKEGEVKNPVILRGVSRELDKEAIRLVTSMPKWTPGKNNGTPVNSYIVLPVSFKLAD